MVGTKSGDSWLLPPTPGLREEWDLGIGEVGSWDTWVLSMALEREIPFLSGYSNGVTLEKDGVRPMMV